MICRLGGITCRIHPSVHWLHTAFWSIDPNAPLTVSASMSPAFPKACGPTSGHAVGWEHMTRITSTFPNHARTNVFTECCAMNLKPVHSNHRGLRHAKCVTSLWQLVGRPPCETLRGMYITSIAFKICYNIIHMLGGCPVKQTKNQKFLRFKKNRENRRMTWCKNKPPER